MKSIKLIYVIFFLIFFASCIPTKKYERNINDQDLPEKIKLLEAKIVRYEEMEKLFLLTKEKEQNTQYEYNSLQAKAIKQNEELQNVIANLKTQLRNSLMYFSDPSTQDNAKINLNLSENINTKNVAVYCPKEMTYETTSDVFGYVADILSDSEIKELMINKIKKFDESDSYKFEDKNFLIKMIQLYKSIELRLEDSDNQGFDIKKIHESNIQDVNSKMEGWHWKVTPTSTKEKQQLILKVIVYDESGKVDNSFTKSYDIEIKIEPKRFIRNTFSLFINNPAWAYGTLIIPLFTFLIGRFSRNSKKKNILDLNKNE